MESHDSINILILGEHENNTDTMILAHIDTLSKKVTLISFPRDLYWKGLKFGNYNQKFGPEQFMKEFSKVTGLLIDRYIRVDMFAFIEAVDALGGIEVDLDSDLYDPTYKTFENGVWSTLYYKKGKHSLNGIQALRIARSRATTMDFGRSKRQHLIIKAVGEKLAQRDALNADVIFKLLGTLTKYVETNLSPFEIVDLVTRYKNAKMDIGHTIDTENILFSTYSNVFFLPEGADINAPDFNPGLWILLPQRGDWKTIPWYIQKIINGEE